MRAFCYCRYMYMLINLGILCLLNELPEELPKKKYEGWQQYCRPTVSIDSLTQLRAVNEKVEWYDEKRKKEDKTGLIILSIGGS